MRNLLKRDAHSWIRAAAIGFAALLLAFPDAARAQCSEKVASFDIVQNAQGDIILPIQLQDTQLDMGLNFSFTWSALRESAAQKLGLQIRKILTKREYHAYGADITHFLDMPSIKLGSMSKRMEMMAIPADARLDPRMNGWLGLDVLADFDVEIDFGHAKLNLFQPGRCSAEKTAYWTKDFDVLSMSVRKFANIDFPAQLDGHPIQVNLDVSNALGLVKMSAGPFEAAPGNDRASFASLKIGRQEIKNIELRVLDDRENPCQPRFQCYGAEAGASVSINQLKDLHLLFAFHDHRIYVSAANAK